MPNITFTVNGDPVTIDAENDDELLYLLRDRLGVTGPKYGCGVGVCGACTIFQDGELARPCVVSMADTAGSDLTTIEGVASGEGDELRLHPVQQAWIDEDVAQCGYCQAGQIMTAIKLLETTSNPSDAQIDAAMSENVCRCGTYFRIRQAIKRAATTPREQTGSFSYKDVQGSYMLTFVDQLVVLTVEATASRQRGSKFRLTASAPGYGTATTEVLRAGETRTIVLPDRDRETRPATTLTVSLDRSGDSFSTSYDLPRVNAVRNRFYP